jgi:hypothetical protein
MGKSAIKLNIGQASKRMTSKQASKPTAPRASQQANYTTSKPASQVHNEEASKPGTQRRSQQANDTESKTQMLMFGYCLLIK